LLALPRTHSTTLPPTHLNRPGSTPPYPTSFKQQIPTAFQPQQKQREKETEGPGRGERKRDRREKTNMPNNAAGVVDTRYQSTTREKKMQTEQPRHHRGLNPRYFPVQGDSAECMPHAPFCTCTRVAYVIPCAVTHSIARSRRDRLKRRIKKVRFLRKQDRKRRTHKHLLSSQINEPTLHS